LLKIESKKVECCAGIDFGRIEIPGFLLERLRKLLRAYEITLEELLCSMATPAKSYYVRVNLLKASSQQAIALLQSEGLRFEEDGRLPEAIHSRVEGPFELEEELAEGTVVADRLAAESVMLGADLYAPGVISVHGSIGSTVAVRDPKGRTVGIGELVAYPNKSRRRGVIVRVSRSLFKAPKVRESRAFREGYIYDQALPSMYVARLLSPSEGDILVDMTASPGGKATHAFEVSGGRARVIAVDHTQSKVRRLLENIRRLEHSGIVVIKADSRTLSKVVPGLKPTMVIVDPPCTSLGNRPRLEFSIKQEQMNNLVRLQRRLLAEASRLVAPGGTISYSTCTITLEENEKIVAWAQRELGLSVEEPRMPVPVSRVSSEPLVRFLPGVHDTPGFFISTLKKH